MEDVSYSHQAYKQAHKELLILKANHMWRDAKVINGLRRITAHFENLPFSDLKTLANALRDYPSTLILLGTSIRDKVNLICTRSQDLDHINANLVLKDAIIQLGGKGGGTLEMAHGGAPKVDSKQVSKVLMESILSI
jgi:alanyl-tRNA synthetase